MSLLEERVVFNCLDKKINFKSKMFLPASVRRFSSGLTELSTLLLLPRQAGVRVPGWGLGFPGPSRCCGAATTR